jgi:hypothetical protein
MTKDGLTLLITVLIIIILGLLLKIGDVWWPTWLVAYSGRIAGILLFITMFLLLLSPIIVDFNSNPRVLSGPGKDPRHG